MNYNSLSFFLWYYTLRCNNITIHFFYIFIFQQRTKIVDLTLDALATLDDDYKGRYIPVDSLTPEQYQQLVDDHLMYRNDNQ